MEKESRREEREDQGRGDLMDWRGEKGGRKEKRKKRGVVEMPQWMKYLCKHELGIQTSSTR